MKKLTRKERKFVDEAENKKNYISYHSVKLYGATDIPLGNAPSAKESKTLVPPSLLWEDFDPTGEPLRAEKLAEGENFATFSFLAASYPDGNLSAEISVRSPSYYAKKAVLLIGDRDALPQKEVVDAIVEKAGAYVFVADYNGVGENSATAFPPSVSYGKHGAEGERADAIPADGTAKDTCAYLYVLILRRAVAFIKHHFPFVELVVTGIRYGVELAMAVAGTEKTDVIALGCLCGAGYPQYAKIPKYPHTRDSFTHRELDYIVSLSGVSYIKNYPHPVFCAVGSNSTYADIDRLSSLKVLISAPLTLSITPRYADCIDREAFDRYVSWLNDSFWHTDFPEQPSTTIDVNRDGTVYADVAASTLFPVKSACLSYSYGDNDHTTRSWTQVPCETVGLGQFLARITFSKPCGLLFYYTVVTYANGLTVTETPKCLDMSSYRLALVPGKSNVVLFRYGAEGSLTGLNGDAIILRDLVREYATPAGVKGAVNDDGPMTLFVKEACAAMEPERILQVDSYRNVPYYPLELEATVASSNVRFRAVKTVTAGGNFASTHFSVTDFKDDKFLALSSWASVTALTIVTPGVVVNKITFI